jgi:hypothetical protein
MPSKRKYLTKDGEGNLKCAWAFLSKKDKGEMIYEFIYT